MFRLRVSKSYGGQAPMKLIGFYSFETKEEAVAEAVKGVPDDCELEWMQGEENDVKFNFLVGSVRYQCWIDESPPFKSLLEDMTTVDPLWSKEKGYYF